jgi:hypothetical protein
MSDGDNELSGGQSPSKILQLLASPSVRRAGFILSAAAVHSAATESNRLKWPFHTVNCSLLIKSIGTLNDLAGLPSFLSAI